MTKIKPRTWGISNVKPVSKKVIIPISTLKSQKTRSILDKLYVDD